MVKMNCYTPDNIYMPYVILQTAGFSLFPSFLFLQETCTKPKTFLFLQLKIRWRPLPGGIFLLKSPSETGPTVSWTAVAPPVPRECPLRRHPFCWRTRWFSTPLKSPFRKSVRLSLASGIGPAKENSQS